MPRIGGPGGPFGPPQTPGAQQTQDAQKPDFAGKVAQTQSTPAQAATQGASEAQRAQQAKPTAQQQLILKTREIAKKLARGTIDQRKATQEFVSLVIEERLPHFKKRKRRGPDDQEDGEGGEDDKQSPEEQLEAAVTELIDRDPDLSKRLQTQLKKLATKG